MRKKTALRRHWKTQPMSPELADAIEQEEAAERGEIIQKPHAELKGIIEQPTAPAATNPAATTKQTPAAQQPDKKQGKKPAAAAAPATDEPPIEDAPMVDSNQANVDFFR
jgi:hypothetical protein